MTLPRTGLRVFSYTGLPDRTEPPVAPDERSGPEHHPLGKEGISMKNTAPPHPSMGPHPPARPPRMARKTRSIAMSLREEDGRPYVDITVASASAGTHSKISLRLDDFLSVAAFLREATAGIEARNRIAAREK